MTWNKWLFGRETSTGPRPSVQDVTFDAMPMRVEKRGPDFIQWLDGDSDRVVAAVDRSIPPLPWTLDELRAHCRRAAAPRDGGIVSVTFARANNVPIAKAISKFEEGLGYRYEGTVMIRFREAVYRLTLEAGEHGRTGSREAFTTALLIPLGELTLPIASSGGTKLDGWMKDPYDDGYAGPTLHALSDDERLDDIMPAHPLSKVRRWLGAIQHTLAIPDDLRGDLVEPPADVPGGESRHRISAYALGFMYLQVGRPDVAEPLLAEGIPRRNGEPDIDAPRIGQRLILLGVAREMLGKLDEAASAHEWAVRAFCTTAGESDHETVRARANLARTYAALRRPDDAEPLLDTVIPLFEAQGNESELAVAVNALGLVRQSQNRHAEALACFERALALFEKLKGPNYVECATVLRNFARSAEATGDQLASRRALKRAEKILQQQPNP